MRDPISARRIFDGDQRVQETSVNAYPWRAIAKIEARRPDGQTEQGTAWFVGPRTLVTAGHCVRFHDGIPGPARSVRVLPGGTAGPVAPVDAVSFTAAPAWEHSAADASDYAVIHIDQPLGATLGTFGFRTHTEPELRSIAVTCAGYPVLKPPVDGGGPFLLANGTLWKQSGSLTVVADPFVFHQLDTEKGQSGCPIFFVDANGLGWVVAIHHVGGFDSNRAIRVTADVQSFIAQRVS